MVLVFLKVSFNHLISALFLLQLNTPISAFKGKGQAVMPKTPRH